MEPNPNLIKPKLTSSRAGYLQKVSRKTGRSRWRKVKRGTKLVKLTAMQHNNNSTHTIKLSLHNTGLKPDLWQSRSEANS